MPTESPKSPPSTRSNACLILTLPTEIELRILSNLPARQISLCRSACKHFRDLIDEKSNITLLFDHGQARARSRLSEEVAFATDFRGVDYLDALARWYTCRGISASNYAGIQARLAFVVPWTEQQNLFTDPDPLVNKSYRSIFCLQALTTLLLMLHATLHLDKERDDSRVYDDLSILSRGPVWNADDILDITVALGITDDDLKVLDITEEVIREYSKQIVTNPDRLMVRSWSDHHELQVPKWPLTQYPSWCTEDVGGESAAEELQPAFGAQWLFSMLEIPEIPFWSRMAFGYGAKTEWARETLESCKCGASISELEKTAILEDVYFY